MGDKEAKTLKEWFGDATRGDGRRFRCHDWMTGDWFEPICLAKGDWVVIDSTGDSFQWGECEDEFELYTEPKKTETRWLWAHTTGVVRPVFCREPFKMYVDGSPAIYDIKLEFSATEFEVDGCPELST